MSKIDGTVIIDIKADTAKLVDRMQNAEIIVKKSVDNMQKTFSSMATDVVAPKGLKDIARQFVALQNAQIGVQKTTKKTGAAFSSIKTIMKAFDIGKVFDIGIDFTKTAMEFEKYNTALKRVEGSSKKANKSMDWITDFSKTTPYGLADVTDSFVKLKAQGIDPTHGTLSTLGDAASSTGKGLSQVVEAMTDALTGENKKLEDFGIKASKTADETTYSWTNASGEAKKAVAKNNAEIIQSIVESIFNDKYAGAMNTQSENLDVMLSNISESYTIFQKNVMDSGLYDYIKALTQVFGEDLNSVLSVTADNSGTATNIMIDAINSIIGAVGFLYDAFTGIQLVINVIETGFLYMTKGITVGIDAVIDAVNFVLEQYNSLPSFLRGEKIELFSNLGTSAIDKKISESKKEFDLLIGSIDDGRKYAEGFTEEVGKAFKVIEKSDSASKVIENQVGKALKVSENPNPAGTKDNASSFATLDKEAVQKILDSQITLASSTLDWQNGLTGIVGNFSGVEYNKAIDDLVKYFDEANGKIIETDKKTKRKLKEGTIKEFKNKTFEIDMKFNGFDEVSKGIAVIANGLIDIFNTNSKIAAQQKVLESTQGKSEKKSTKALHEKKKLDKLVTETNITQLGTYANMSEAMGSFYDEDDSRKKKQAEVTKVLHMTQMGLQLASLFQTVTVETSKQTIFGTTALAASLTMGFPASLAAFATIAALLASIGIAVSGGGGGESVSENKQKFGNIAKDTKRETEQITSRLDRQISLLDIISKSGSVSFMKIASSKATLDGGNIENRANLSAGIRSNVFNRGYEYADRDYAKNAVKSFYSQFGKQYGYESKAWVDKMYAASGDLDPKQFKTDLESFFAHATIADVQTFMNSPDYKDIMAGGADAKDYAGYINTIKDNIVAYSTAVMDTATLFGDAILVWQDYSDVLNQNNVFSAKRLEDAQNSLSGLMKDTSSSNYAELFSTLGNLSVDFSGLTDAIVSGDLVKIETETRLLDTALAHAGKNATYTAEELINMKDSLVVVGDAASVSTSNIQTWNDSKKTEADIAATTDKMFRDLVSSSEINGTTYINNLGKIPETMSALNKVMETLSTDTDGLTDADLEYYFAQKSLIESSDTVANSIDAVDSSMVSFDSTMVSLAKTLQTAKQAAADVNDANVKVWDTKDNTTLQNLSATAGTLATSFVDKPVDVTRTGFTKRTATAEEQINNFYIKALGSPNGASDLAMKNWLFQLKSGAVTMDTLYAAIKEQADKYGQALEGDIPDLLTGVLEPVTAVEQFTKKVGATFATIPKTREELNTIVKQLEATGVNGAEFTTEEKNWSLAYSKYFDDLDAEIAATKKLASDEFKNLTDQKFQLTATDAEKRLAQLNDTIDETNYKLLESIFVEQDRQRLSTSLESLNNQLSDAKVVDNEILKTKLEHTRILNSLDTKAEKLAQQKIWDQQKLNEETAKHNAMIATTNTNLQSFADSFYTPLQLAKNMAQDAGVELETSMSGLIKLTAKLANDADGLTNSDLELIKANKAILQNTDKLTEKLNAATSGISTLEGVLSSLHDKIFNLKSAALGSSFSLEEYYKSMKKTMSLSGTEDYAGYAKALQDTIDKSSVLLDAKTFDNSNNPTMDQKFAQLVAANQFGNMEDVALSQIDLLQIIADNTKGQIDQISKSVDTLSINLMTTLNSLLATNIKPVNVPAWTGPADLNPTGPYHPHTTMTGTLTIPDTPTGNMFSAEILAAQAAHNASVLALRNHDITGFANGGIVTKPTLGLVAEAGYNEAIIPLKNPTDPLGMGMLTKEIRALKSQVASLQKDNNKHQSEIVKNTKESRYVS